MFGNDRTDSAWLKSGTTCNEWSRVPDGNLRRSEIFQPTATSKRFVVGLPQRNASCFPCRTYAKRPFPTSSEIACALYTYNALSIDAQSRTIPRALLSTSPNPCHLSVVIYLDWADEWCSLDTTRARRRTAFYAAASSRKYTCRRWELIAFMQH